MDSPEWTAEYICNKVGEVEVLKVDSGCKIIGKAPAEMSLIPKGSRSRFTVKGKTLNISQ